MIAAPLIHFDAPTTERIVKDDDYWAQRFWNPEVRMRWNSEIAVEPANRDKGHPLGTRIYPNGARETFRINL